jgi:aromatic-L-amino-acid/L-tryptophan decarboxylase
MSDERPARRFGDVDPEKFGRRGREAIVSGRSGIEARRREHERLGRLFASWVDEDPDWERIAPPSFGTVVFRLRPRDWAADDPRLDGLNERLLAGVNASGEASVSHVVLPGRYAIRVAIGKILTEERDMQRAWEILRAEAARLGALPTVVASGPPTAR